MAFPPLQEVMHPHLALLSDGSRNWKEFVAYLHQSLRLLVRSRTQWRDLCEADDGQDEKACFSRVGKLHHHDYSVTFSDGQDLQGLQRKFFRTLVVLESTIEIVRGCRSHSEDLRSRGVGIGSNIFHEMESLNTNLSYYKRLVTSLLEYSKGTANLVLPAMFLTKQGQLTQRYSLTKSKNIGTTRSSTSVTRH